MRILINSPVVYPILADMHYAGIERLGMEYAQGLAKLGHSVSLTCAPGSISLDGIELIICLQGGAEAEQVAYPIYADKLEGFDAILDLSHFHAPAMNKPNLPALNVFWHDPLLAKYPEPSYNILAISQYAKRNFELIYEQSAYYQEIIEVDPTVYYPAQAFLLPPSRFLAAGRMGVDKGQLEAMRICRKLDAPLDVVGASGQGDPTDYENLVRRFATGDICFWGNCLDEEKIKLMQSCKALIYPVAQVEIHSHKSVEAMFCGAPVIAYNIGAMEEVVGSAGRVVNTEEEFISAMLTADSISRRYCREYSTARWSRNKVIPEISKLLEEVAGGKRW